MLRLTERYATMPSVRGVSRILVVLALAWAGCSSFERPKARNLPAAITFQGTWDSTWGRLELRQDGKHVAGSFTGFRDGGLSGELDGDVWHFIWDQRHPHQHGRGFMQLSPDGQHLEGRWGYMKDDIEGGRWAADREGGG
jgi:hypothetical protein